MSDQHSEPRVWEIPVEPPVGTVVTGPNEFRFRHVETGGWHRLDDDGTEYPSGVSWIELLRDHCGGRVVEVPATPAEALALRLESLARHLRAHRELSAINVQRDKVQLSTNGGASALVAWADSMLSPSIRVQSIEDEAYVYVTGRLVDGIEETVWTVVPGFHEFLAGRGNIEISGAYVDVSPQALAKFVLMSTEAGA